MNTKARLILTSSFIFLLFLFSPKFAKATIIECYTQYGICPGEWLVELDGLKNSPLLRPLPETKVSEMLKGHSQINSFSLYRRLPSTLVVSIKLRKPLGAVGNESQVLGIADENGVVFSTSDSNQLPRLLVTSQPELNSQLSDTQTKALSALSLLNTFSSTPLTGELDHTTLKVRLPGSAQVLIDVKSDPKRWYAPLQLILERSKISPKSPATIDLRFTNPVISYN